MGYISPKVSIGMPVYNGENFIKEAIDSILNQTFKDFELIICDNASTDKTEEICKEYAAKDKRVKYFRNKENFGAAYNYNHVFKLAKGKYFKWAAHDDIILPDFLDVCVKSLDKAASSFVLSYTKPIIINEKGQEIYKDKRHYKISSKPHKRLKELIMLGLCHSPVFGVIRNDVLKNTSLIGNFPASDKVLLAELAIKGNFLLVPEYLMKIREHPEHCSQKYKTNKRIAIWFDPRNAKKIVLPQKAKLFIEYFKLINSAKIGLSEKIKCYFVIVVFGILRGVKLFFNKNEL